MGGGCIDGTWQCPNVTCTEPPAQPICGPVRWDGDGLGASHDEAVSAARKNAIRACETTPSLCFVDCVSGRVVSANCSFTAVQPADGSEPAVTWQCHVVVESGGK